MAANQTDRSWCLVVVPTLRSCAYTGCWRLMKVVRAGCAGIVVGVVVLLSACDWAHGCNTKSCVLEIVVLFQKMPKYVRNGSAEARDTTRIYTHAGFFFDFFAGVKLLKLEVSLFCRPECSRH